MCSPLRLIAVSEMVSKALPLKCVASCAASTWPVTGVPCASTTMPSVMMSEAMAPVNLSPLCVVALSSVWVMRTAIAVPAGRVRL